MKIAMVTIGTQGDVLPLLAVGVRLKEAGHEVSFGTQQLFAADVREAGLEFRPLPGDSRELLASETGRAWRTARSMAAANKATLQVGLQMQTELSAGIVAAAEGAELLITNYIAEVHGYLLATAMGIPFMSLHYFPGVPTAEFLPAMVGTFSLGGWLNRRLPRWATRMRTVLDAGVRDFQRELGLAPASLGSIRLALTDDPRVFIPNGFSPAIVPQPADWRPGVEVVGFWWPPEPTGWQPDAAVVDFLEAGPPPVFVGLGSMAAGDGERLSALFSAALRQAGVRGIIQSGWADLASSDDDILCVGAVSHDWLFPRTAAVVCHAGSGTTGKALRAGVPFVPVPMLGDQPFWAARTVRIGVSPGAAPFTKLSVGLVADLIGRATGEPGYRQRAQQVAAQVRADDGAGRVVESVARIEAASLRGSA